MKLPSKEHTFTFIGGAIAALAFECFAKSKTARKLVVSGAKNSMRLRDGAVKIIESIREEAQDAYEEALREPEENE